MYSSFKTTDIRDRLPLIPMILCDLEVPGAGAPSPLACLSRAPRSFLLPGFQAPATKAIISDSFNFSALSFVD